jgi:hypothetical protein
MDNECFVDGQVEGNATAADNSRHRQAVDGAVNRQVVEVARVALLDELEEEMLGTLAEFDDEAVGLAVLDVIERARLRLASSSPGPRRDGRRTAAGLSGSRMARGT